MLSNEANTLNSKNVGKHHQPRYDSSILVGSSGNKIGTDKLMSYFPEMPFTKPNYPPPYVVQYLMGDDFALY